MDLQVTQGRRGSPRRTSVFGCGAFVGSLVLALASPADSCDCLRLPPPSPATATEADVIFQGRTIELVERSEHVTRTRWGSSEGSVRFLEKWVAFEVRRSWRGVSSDTILVAVDNSDCSFQFDPGSEYVVFADRNRPGKPSTNACMRTMAVENADVVLRVLGHGRDHARGRTTR